MYQARLRALIKRTGMMVTQLKIGRTSTLTRNTDRTRMQNISSRETATKNPIARQTSIPQDTSCRQTQSKRDAVKSSDGFEVLKTVARQTLNGEAFATSTMAGMATASSWQRPCKGRTSQQRIGLTRKVGKRRKEQGLKGRRNHDHLLRGQVLASGL